MRHDEELGAKVQVLDGREIAEEILSFARAQNVAFIVTGLSRRNFSNRWLRGSIVNKITNHSGPIHVFIIGSTEVKTKEKEMPLPEGTISLWPYYGSLHAWIQ